MILKKTSLALCLTLFSAALMAAPAMRGLWKTLTLADGTQVRAELRGDEYMKYWVSEQGEPYVRSYGKSHFEKADMSLLTGNSQKLRLQEGAALKKVRAERAASAKKSPRKIGIWGDHPELVGEKRGIIILVEFQDKAFGEGHDKEYYTHLANDPGFTHPDGHNGSIRDFFLKQSNQQLDITFDVAGPYVLEHEMAYYGGNDRYGSDLRPEEMIQEAVKAAAEELGTFEPYDWFGDGWVDQVFVVYAGMGEQMGGSEDTVWPHRRNISTVTLGGKKVSVYACANEMYNATKVQGIGTFCHEFSHCLGLVDLYDVYYGAWSGGNRFYGMGHWDVMDQGCYLGTTYSPCHYSGMQMNYCGWKEPVVLRNDTVVSGLKGIADGGDYFVIYNDGCPNEYYTIEYRDKAGWDRGVYNSGLVITAVDYNESIWQSNIVNTVSPKVNDHPRCQIILADNNPARVKVSDVKGDVFPFEGNDSLTNLSTPAATLYNLNTDSTYFMNKPITEIRRNDDGTMSFRFRNLNKRVGDVNGDGKVDAADVEALVEGILEQTFTEATEEADVNGDGKVDINDVVRLIGRIAQE